MLSLVVLGFHSTGGFIEGFLGFLMNNGHVFGEVSGSGVRERGGSERVWQNAWVSTIEHHEGTLSSGAVDTIVVCKLSEREPVAPVRLSVVDEDTKVFFDFLIDLFCLSVCLWVEGHESVRGDIEHSV